MKKPDELYIDAIKGIIMDITPLLYRNDPIDWKHICRMILKISETHLNNEKI